MSSTRKARAGSPMRQERYASAAAYKGGLLGNLVARRCSLVRSRDARDVIYFLADLSHRGSRRMHYSCCLFPAWPWPSFVAREEAPFDRVARELHEFYPQWCQARAVKYLPKYFPKLCLDSKLDPERAAVPGCPDLIKLLLDYKERHETAHQVRIALTETTRLVYDALEYTLSQRGLVLIEGTYRVGKSLSAQGFALKNISKCRYVQLTSARDEGAFFRSIAHGVGVACSSQMKAAEMRQRIEAALREQHLSLILDEGDFVLPHQVRPTETPQRLSWILTSLVNNGCGVALIVSRNFQRLLTNLESKLKTYGLEQFRGRLRLRRPLPDRPTRADLEAIIHATMPDGTSAMKLLLLGHALRSDIPVAAIESAVARAQWFADADDRPMVFADLQKTMVEVGTLPAETVEVHAVPVPRSLSATPSRQSRERVAAT